MAFSCISQQRTKSTSSSEHVRKLAVGSSEADLHFQQLDKLRMVYEEYVKLGKETMPLLEIFLKELREDLEEKSQAYEDVMITAFPLSPVSQHKSLHLSEFLS